MAQADGDADPEAEADLRLIRRESSQRVDAAVIALWSIAGIMTVLLGVYVWHTSPRRRLRLARRRMTPIYGESQETDAQPSDLVPEQLPETPSDLVPEQLPETPSDLVSGELSETPSEPALEQLPSTPAAEESGPEAPAEVESPGAVPTVEDRGVWELAEAELRGGAGPAGAEAEPAASAAADEESDAQRPQGFWPRLRHLIGLD